MEASSKDEESLVVEWKRLFDSRAKDTQYLMDRRGTRLKTERMARSSEHDSTGWDVWFGLVRHVSLSSTYRELSVGLEEWLGCV